MNPVTMNLPIALLDKDLFTKATPAPVAEFREDSADVEQSRASPVRWVFGEK
jgi:hypothetical protein